MFGMGVVISIPFLTKENINHGRGSSSSPDRGAENPLTQLIALLHTAMREPVYRVEVKNTPGAPRLFRGKGGPPA